MTTREDVKARIEAIEEAYEFFLAYAAQGVSGDRAAKSGGQLREFMARAVDALEGLGDRFRAAVQEAEPEGGDAWAPMLDVLDRDARAAHAAVGLVAEQASISSQLVDNLNANIHLRAVLTDLFLVDEILKG
ncbi:MAG: hypothetical protein PVJ02_05625 [Gemmatimonadota bacterium]